MKTIYLPLICAIVIFSSCSSAYKTAQTPDDVYYSPGSQRQSSSSSTDDQYYNANSDDQYLMMKSQNPNRWSYFDDYSTDNFYYSPYYSAYGMYSPYGLYSPYGFGYSPFGFYSGFGFSPFMSFGFGYWGPSYINSYYLWNGYYNPYYGGAIVASKSAPAYYGQLHPFTLTNYTGTAINNSNTFRSYNPSTRTTSLNPQNRFTRFSNSPANNTNNNSFNNSNRFNSNNNNNFFRSQSTQSTRSFGSFGGGGGGGRTFSRGR